MNINGTEVTTPLLLEPRTVVEPHGEKYLRIRFQDPETKADLVIVKIPRELAATLADNIRSMAP